jgi:hypothetical protein
MTDFLTRLTARSFGAGTTVRPRVASLFETACTGETAPRESPAEPGVTNAARNPESGVGSQPRIDSLGRGAAVFDRQSFDRQSFDRQSFDRQSFDRQSFDRQSFDRQRWREPGTAAAASFPADSSIESHPSSTQHSDLEEEMPSATFTLAGAAGEGEMTEEHTVVAAMTQPQMSLAAFPPRTSRSGSVIEMSRGTSIVFGEASENETRGQESTVSAAKELAENCDLSQSVSLLRSDLEDGAPRRLQARMGAVSSSRNELFDSDNRGLVLPPRAALDLTTQMKNAASALGAGSRTPSLQKAASVSPAPAAESESSVYVTIGRIEVRATSESKNTGRARAASPVMSLEEYLHRRTPRGDR